MTMASCDVPLGAIDEGVKDLAAVGGKAVTVSEAEAAAALAPLEVCSAPAASVFVAVPARVEVTSTVTVQLPALAPLPAGMLRVAGSVIEPLPADATTAPAPEHVVEAFGVAATTRPPGSESTSAA